MCRNQLVIFDGVCNLCNGTVQFIIKRDRNKKFSFITRQSPIGQEMLMQLGLPVEDQSTVVYLKAGVPYLKSMAVLKILKDLGRGWSLLYVLVVIPAFIRDFIYDLIAKNRYRFFGRRNSCKVPGSEMTDRFLQ
jgi:predicted DCC family thiol-disulfide oxidoreductase YuxK